MMMAPLPTRSIPKSALDADLDRVDRPVVRRRPSMSDGARSMGPALLLLGIPRTPLIEIVSSCHWIRSESRRERLPLCSPGTICRWDRSHA